MPSTFGVEAYGNYISGSSGQIFKTRGGSSFIYSNTVTGATPYGYGYWGTMVTCPTVSPLEQMIHDTYIWNNRQNFNGSTGGIVTDTPGGPCAGLDNWPTAGRDIFNESTSPGITYGTLANIPASCSVGQGYWATNQSTTDLTGFVGDIVTYPTRQTIAGTLYKCTATNTWTSFYTPYTYPHPLTVTGSPPVVDSLSCNPTKVQTPSGTTTCTATVSSGTPASWAWSFSANSLTQCSTSSTSISASVSCLYGGASPTICALAHSANGDSNNYCTTTAINVAYRKPTNFGVR
jgi:hypothetical protein